jgi:hypothetical protein
VYFVFGSGEETFQDLDIFDVDINILTQFLSASPDVEGMHVFFIKTQEGGEWGLEIKAQGEARTYKSNEMVDVLWDAVCGILDNQ